MADETREAPTATLEDLMQRAAFYSNLSKASKTLATSKDEGERAKARSEVNKVCIAFDGAGDPKKELSSDTSGNYINAHKPAMAQYALDYLRSNKGELVAQTNTGKLEKAVLMFTPVEVKAEGHEGAYKIHSQFKEAAKLREKFEKGEVSADKYCETMAKVAGSAVEGELKGKKIKENYIKDIVGVVTGDIRMNPILAGRENQVMIARAAGAFEHYFAEGDGAKAGYTKAAYAVNTLLNADISKDNDASMEIVNNILACAPSE